MISLRRAALAAAASVIATNAAAADETCGWVGSWGASQQLVEERNELPLSPLEDVTIRQTVSPTLPGEKIRLRLSNEFGDGPLVIGGAAIADADAAGSSKITKGSAVKLTFAGKPSVTIPVGAAYYADPVAFKVTPFDDVAITLHVVSGPENQSGHPGSRTTTHYVRGDQLEKRELKDAETIDRWYYIAGIDVIAQAPSATIGVIGDSITDGRGSTTNENNRWTDYLAQRLSGNDATDDIGVINLGLGGNRVLQDGLGPNVLARIDRDVLAQPNMRYVIVYEGINDIGTLAQNESATQADHDALVENLKGAFAQVIARAHGHGLKVYGATIAPFKGAGFYPFTTMAEATRQRVNEWIRTSGAFDAVFDFDEVLRDPDDPTQLLPEFDIGDHLHPSPAGFEAIAASIPLDLFPAPASCE